MTGSHAVLPLCRFYKTVVVAGAVIVPAVIVAQYPALTTATGIEIGAQTGLVRTNAAGTATLPSLRTAHVGVHTRWHYGALEADAALYAGATASQGERAIQPLGLFRIAARRGPLTLLLGVEQGTGVSFSKFTSVGTTRDDTIPNTGQTATSNSSLVQRIANTADLVGGIGFTTGPAALHLLSGTRVTGARWLGADATIAIGQSSALLVAARRQSDENVAYTPTLSLGFRTTYWHWGSGVPIRATPSRTTRPGAPDGTASSQAVRVEIAPEAVRLYVRLDGATHVAVTGDATDWTPLDMTRDDRGWWVASLPTPGDVGAASRIQLRRDDGAWEPVPGLPTTRDEYGGTVSLLLAPADTSLP